VGHDLEGLRTAVAEIFEEALLLEARERTALLMQGARGRESGLAVLPCNRTLSPGYYDWAHYLLWLDGERRIAIPLELAAHEMEGLRIVEQERNRFLREHPACPQCGAINQKFAFNCQSCGAEFKPRGAGGV